MRVIISCNKSGSEVCLPIQYNQYIQGLIYSHLDKDIAEKLHNYGLPHGQRKLKFFTYSRLLGNFRLDKEAGKIIFKGPIKLVVSTPLKELCISLLNNIITQNQITLGNQSIPLNEIRAETPEINKDNAKINLLSPVVTYSTLYKGNGDKYTCYFRPGEKEFGLQIQENLRKKYEAFFQETPPDKEVEIRVLSKPKMNLVTYKGTVIKGYTCHLKLYGPQELIQMGLDAGLGAKNSQGFGCVELVAE